MDRTPPVEIRRILRREVGFGCPLSDCANPYLEYHHFDPPWHVEEHHEPRGMIALCAEHHRKADGGAFTVDQLRELKRPAVTEVVGRFDWLRNDVLAVVGGSLYYETPIIFAFKGERAIWFERDQSGLLLFNIRMVTQSGEQRLRLENNDWLVRGSPVDFESPPSGRRIYARYANGDSLKVEFREITDLAAAHARYAHIPAEHWLSMTLPITCVEVEEQFGGSEWGFGPTWTKLGGVRIRGAFVSHCGTGLSWS
jgi:hypothetical protein